MACRIMVVEDDRDIREALVEFLLDEGFEPIAAVNGSEALEHLKRVEPHLILLDLMMPVMDGRAFRKAQLELPDRAHIPVVVISAFRDVSMDVITMNAAAVLKKPIKLDELRAVADRFC
jgi:DNA-binding response OmpR family regulator